MKKKTEVVVIENKPKVTANDELSVESFISKAITMNAPVETMERLFALRKEMKAETAKEAFISAMSNFQSECPTIKKTKEVRTKSGDVAYRYAPIESIVTQVKDALKNNGFSYSTNVKVDEAGVTAIVVVQHVLGHSEAKEMTVPLGSKTSVMSDSQVVAAASTFAKRYAFLNAFGILTGDEDNDGAKLPESTPTRMPSVFEVASGMVSRTTDVKVLNEYWKKIEGSTKYSEEEKSKLEGLIAARVEELNSTEEVIES